MVDSENEFRGNEASRTMAYIFTFDKNFDEAHSRVRVLISLQDFGWHMMFNILHICRRCSYDSVEFLYMPLNLGIKKILIFILLLDLRVERTLEFVRL